MIKPNLRFVIAFVVSVLAFVFARQDIKAVQNVYSVYESKKYILDNHKLNAVNYSENENKLTDIQSENTKIRKRVILRKNLPEYITSLEKIFTSNNITDYSVEVRNISESSVNEFKAIEFLNFYELTLRGSGKFENITKTLSDLEDVSLLSEVNFYTSDKDFAFDSVITVPVIKIQNEIGDFLE